MLGLGKLFSSYLLFGCFVSLGLVWAGPWVLRERNAIFLFFGNV
jgi:hypothetical protein